MGPRASAHTSGTSRPLSTSCALAGWIHGDHQADGPTALVSGRGLLHRRASDGLWAGDECPYQVTLNGSWSGHGPAQWPNSWG